MFGIFLIYFGTVYSKIEISAKSWIDLVMNRANPHTGCIQIPGDGGPAAARPPEAAKGRMCASTLAAASTLQMPLAGWDQKRTNTERHQFFERVNYFD